MLFGEVFVRDAVVTGRILAGLNTSHWLALQVGRDQALIDITGAFEAGRKFYEICRTITP